MAEKKKTNEPDPMDQAAAGKEPRYYNIGNASFDIDVTKTMTRDDFIKKYAGTVNFDLGLAYDTIKKMK